MKLKKGDTIKVVHGKDSGKTGPIEKVWPKENKVTVTGVNMFKRHMKARVEGQKSGIMDVTKPLSVANVALVCPKCKKETRVGYKVTAKSKVRICRKCEAEI